MDKKQQISDRKTSVGIEFGSTRIKAVLLGEDLSILAEGFHDWENRLENGVWTYSEDDIRAGMRECFSSLMQNVRERYRTELTGTGALGISAMMHGYLAFDGDGKLLVPFRTWRNTSTSEAAEILSEKFGFNIPQRWSIAHLYQAILNREEHVPKIRFITTLAGYVHWLLTGKKVIGTGDASGMFPVGHGGLCYDSKMLGQFAKLTENTAFKENLADILPEIIPVGECAGTLTEEGAKLLDPSGVFRAGVRLCPPEGDAQTGMVATNSIAPKTGNVSAGTSIFGMAVLEKELSKRYAEIDIVATPCGDPAAMVHCNNCTGDLDEWVALFGEALRMFGREVPKAELYDRLYNEALAGEAGCGGIVSCNYFSGEHVTGFTSGRPLLLREPNASLCVANLMRSLIFSSMATLAAGMEILRKQENITLEKIYAHGGLFKTPVVGQRLLAAALGVPVEVMRSAGEGGAWGIAILAAYMQRIDRAETLKDYLENRVFAGSEGTLELPSESDVKGFADYSEKFAKLLEAERTAVNVL